MQEINVSRFINAYKDNSVSFCRSCIFVLIIYIFCKYLQPKQLSGENYEKYKFQKIPSSRPFMYKKIVVVGVKARKAPSGVKLGSKFFSNALHCGICS